MLFFWLCSDLWTSNVWLMMVCKCMSFYDQSVCLLLFTLFSKCMHQGSQWYMLWKFKGLFDGILINLRIDMMDRHTVVGPIWLKFFDRRVGFIHWQALFITTLQHYRTCPPNLFSDTILWFLHHPCISSMTSTIVFKIT